MANSSFSKVKANVAGSTRTRFHLVPSSGPPGDRYWVFKEVVAEPGYPHSLVEMGSSLPKEGIDTALHWEPVGKTYLFKGDQYWRYSEEKQATDPGYPKPIAVWKGVPHAPQGAFISREGCECRLTNVSSALATLAQETEGEACSPSRTFSKGASLGRPRKPDS